MNYTTIRGYCFSLASSSLFSVFLVLFPFPSFLPSFALQGIPQSCLPAVIPRQAKNTHPRILVLLLFVLLVFPFLFPPPLHPRVIPHTPSNSHTFALSCRHPSPFPSTFHSFGCLCSWSPFPFFPSFSYPRVFTIPRPFLQSSSPSRPLSSSSK